ncbi:MAG: FkbM family methyltransferase [Actinobacteria bacterium]|nr:FkbM family methyltransferase [Actinomycetota bacterium]
MPLSTRIRKALASRVTSHGPKDRISRTIVDRAAGQYGCTVSYGNDTVSVRRGNEVVRISSKDMVHVPHIARDFDVFFSAVDAEDVPPTQIVDYSTPRVHRYRQLDLDLLIPSMQEAIDVDAVYCPHSSPAAGDVVYDLGANIGVVSIWLARKVGASGRVVSFEPDPQNFRCLTSNVTTAGLSNIEPIPAALSDVTGTAPFFSEGSIGSGFESLRADSMLPMTSGDRVEVQTLTLADAFEHYGVPKWMKIDIEGAELELLESGLTVLAETMPQLAIETDHLRGSNTTAARVEELLKSVGYKVTTGRVGGTQMTWTVSA